MTRPEPVQADLFGGPAPPPDLRPGIVLLAGRAADPAILAGLGGVIEAAPFRHMRTPGGQAMSAAMTNCGPLGWVTDRRGYRYEANDPETGRPWPAMPDAWRRLARDAAAEAGFAGFAPDACLVNRYGPGARMGLHRDGDEAAFDQPIVSVSLGLPATFLLGGPARADKTVAISLTSGDVLVFGGPERLVYHGVRPVKLAPGYQPPIPLLADCRINLTFRRAR